MFHFLWKQRLLLFLNGILLYRNSENHDLLRSKSALYVSKLSSNASECVRCVDYDVRFDTFVLYPFHDRTYGCLLREHVPVPKHRIFFSIRSVSLFSSVLRMLVYLCRLFSFTLKSYDYGLVQLGNILCKSCMSHWISPSRKMSIMVCLKSYKKCWKIFNL